MTELVVEQADLSDGSGVVYKDYPDHVRMAYDPRQVTEQEALAILRTHHPKFSRLVPLLQATA